MRAVFCVALLGAVISAAASEVPFFIGTYSKPGKQGGILRAELDLQTGALSKPRLAAHVANPSFLAVSPGGRFLYAACEAGSGEVAAFRLGDPLVPLNSQPSGGAGACHVSSAGNHVFVANYSGGNVASFVAGPDGKLGGAASLVGFTGSGPNPQRQQKPFAHCVIAAPGGRHVYVCDLGTDRVWIFQCSESGVLTPGEPAFASVPPGSGPRHLAVSADGKFVYVNTEMGLSVCVFSRDPETGALTLLQTLPTLPEGTDIAGVSTAGIALNPLGRWLYVSNRGHDSITVFRVGDDGLLSFLENVPATVKTPRGFAVDPTGRWLVVAGQADGAIASLEIDQETGRLSPKARQVTESVPVAISFVSSE